MSRRLVCRHCGKSIKSRHNGWGGFVGWAHMNGLLWCQITTAAPVPVAKEGPHARACGASKHSHGYTCHENCPTCHGREDSDVAE